MIGNALGALYFIVRTLLSMLLFVFMLRVLLQWARADFRNPLAQAVVKITNPLVMPLRRVLPPIGKIDTSSIVAVLIVAALGELILSLFTRRLSAGSAALDEARRAQDHLDDVECLFLGDPDLCGTQHDRAGRLFAHAVVARRAVRAGAAAVSPHHPAHRRTSISRRCGPGSPSRRCSTSFPCLDHPALVLHAGRRSRSSLCAFVRAPRLKALQAFARVVFRFASQPRR